MAVKQLKDGRWTVYYWDRHRKKRWEYFGRGNKGKKDAEARDYEVKALKKRGQDIQANRARADLADIAQAYLDHLKTKGVSYKFRLELKQLLENHIIPLIGNVPPERLNDSDFARVTDYYRGRNSSQSTINRYIRYLRTMFRFAVSRGYLTRNPLEHWQKPKEAPRRLRLTVPGLRALIKNAEPHLAWALEVLWNLGCRPGTSELTSLRWEDVDWENSRVWIWGSKTTQWRDVPVTGSFLQRLKQVYRTAETDYIIEYKGNPVKKFRRSVKTAARRTGLHSDLCLYEVRHLFATVMIQGGGDLSAVSKLLGHASTHMTADVYYGYMKGEKERAVGLLPEINESSYDKDKKIVDLNNWKNISN